MKVPEGSLQAWVPGPDLSIAEVVDLAFDYRGNVTVEKADGTPVTGYVFNRHATAPVPFLEMFDEAGSGPFEIPYAQVRTIRFTGRDTAAGTSWKAWVERHEAEKKARILPREALVLTGIDLEARWLARALALPALPEYPFPAFGDRCFRLAAVGLRARRLDDRFEALATGLSSPLVVSAGLCGALAPELGVAALVVPEVVLGRGDERSVTAVIPGPRREGTLVTVEEITATPAARAELRAATGAIAADMESSLILAAAARKGWPGLVLRAVSDDAQTGLPQALLRLVDTDGRLRMGAAVATLLARPALLPRALELRRTSRRALDVVAEALRPLLACRPET